MIEVFQAFDRAQIATLESDDAAKLDRKIETARRLFADRHAWLKPHQRIEILWKLAALMEGGDPLLPETEVGPLILPRQADRISAWTEDAVSAVAKLIGGGRINSSTLIPSIIVNPPRDAKVSTLEVFGPITCVYPFTRLDDAVAAANSLPVAFQASIFTEDLRTAFDAAERLDALAVMVNDYTAFRTDWMHLRWPPGIRLWHLRHSLDDAGNVRAEDDRVQDVGNACSADPSTARGSTERIGRSVYLQTHTRPRAAKNWSTRPRPTLRAAVKTAHRAAPTAGWTSNSQFLAPRAPA